MKTRHILKKQLSMHPSRFILGCIGPSRELFPKVNPDFLQAIEREVGDVEEVLPPQDFPNPPESYFTEMGSQPLTTTMIILGEGGAHSDLHFLKQDAIKVEEQFPNLLGGRTFNINPGAVSTYGLCLATHKPTGNRPDSMPWRWHHYALSLFGPESYYERVMSWRSGKMERVVGEDRFPEYHEASRVAKFGELVGTLKKSDRSVELFA